MDEGGGLAIDSISKGVANLYVPGVVIHALTPRADANPEETKQLIDTLKAVVAGNETALAPGLAARWSPALRERMAAMLRPPDEIESLGDERIGPRHFVANPAIVRLRRYRLRSPSGTRFLTTQLAANGVLIGAILEE